MTIQGIEGELSVLPPIEGLAWLDNKFGNTVKLSTALGPEAQLLAHWISSQQLDTEIFTIDTGRLFQETYDLIDETNARLQSNIKVYLPDALSVESLVAAKGANSFYNSVDDRLECCRIRKVSPLKRALKDATVWVTGLRAEQSHARQYCKLIEWNKTHEVIKYNPLIHWTQNEVMEQINTHNIPINKLLIKGFKSIGCQPCTRAVSEEEEDRAGRWWWEDSHKECGLHLNPA
ncbi:MAG: phosphoadenylyl-sulfate reductase [Cyclobacteriaceae bacterium]